MDVVAQLLTNKDSKSESSVPRRYVIALDVSLSMDENRRLEKMKVRDMYLVSKKVLWVKWCKTPIRGNTPTSCFLATTS